MNVGDGCTIFGGQIVKPPMATDGPMTAAIATAAASTVSRQGDGQLGGTVACFHTGDDRNGGVAATGNDLCLRELSMFPLLLVLVVRFSEITLPLWALY